MKKLLILLIIPFLSFGQGWEYNYGGINGQGGFSVCQTSNGGYVVGGEAWPDKYGLNDIYLLKTDINGVEEWSYIYEDGFQERCAKIIQSLDGGYVICGQQRSLGSGSGGFSDVLFIKTDSNGLLEWTQTYGGDGYQFGFDVLSLADGGYLVVGENDNKPYLLKIDSVGTELWSTTYSQMASSSANSVKQTVFGNYIITGWVNSNGSNETDIFIIKADSLGNIMWVQNYGDNTTSEGGLGIEVSNDGGYVVCANKKPAGEGDSTYDIFVVKTDIDGNVLWEQTYGNGDKDIAREIKKTNDGGYILVGDTRSFIQTDNDDDIYLLKINSIGEEEWSVFYGTEFEDESGYDVQQTNDGGYVLCGIAGWIDNINQSEVSLIKTDEFGNITSTNIIETPTIKKNLITTVDILGRETTNNGLQLHIYDDGTVEKKYVIK